MDELSSVFDRAFHVVLEVVQAQGRSVTGPPFGYYPRMPGATVAVAAGFPVEAPITPSGDVTALELPGGRAVTAVHVGPFDTLERTYHELLEWAKAEGLVLADEVWESYLTDPRTEPDPARWQTAITWPLRSATPQ
jgi:effector-binding domain-containing protein